MIEKMVHTAPGLVAVVKQTANVALIVLIDIFIFRYLGCKQDLFQKLNFSYLHRVGIFAVPDR
jgi:hypothetical protein